MSKYSEMVGSFSRMGNFPMEAHYIFPTEAALKEFYNDPVNKATIHRGLLKIVENGGSGKQALYWVAKKQTSNELEFVRLIENLDISYLNEQLNNLQIKLNEEIKNRKDSEQAIWGTDDPTNIPEELNSLLDLSATIAILKTEVKALAGTEESDIISYLRTLPYKDFTEISNILNKFFNTVDGTSDKINTLPELQSFLENYTDKQKLHQVLSDLKSSILGNPVPSKDFCTLRTIEDFVRVLKSNSEYTDRNLQSEINQTQIGVGLDSDGLYSPDQETNFLKTATSVMNALRTLDSKVKEALEIKSSIIEKGYYDVNQEALIIKFKGNDEEYHIPVANLITEWTVENSLESPIKLEKIRVPEGGPDILMADIILDSNSENILEKQGNKLLVNGKLLLKYIEFDGKRKTLQLENHDTLSGKDTNGTGYNLAMISKWDVADFGSSSIPINLNGNRERPTYNDSEEIALLKDLNQYITKDEADEQYSAKNELDWYEG